MYMWTTYKLMIMIVNILKVCILASHLEFYTVVVILDIHRIELVHDDILNKCLHTMIEIASGSQDIILDVLVF